MIVVTEECGVLGMFQNTNSNFYFALSYIANLCQLADFQMNVSQLSNDDLMKHLLQQDNILNEEKQILYEQTNIYLKKIVEQNEKIISQNNEMLKLIKGE